MDLKDIGLRIKYLRQSLGLTQRELADKIGTTWEMVSRYETGKSSPMGRIDNIADALNVPIYKIIQSSTLEEEGASYSKNVVPLLTKSFDDLTKAINNSKSFYTAPDWITQKFLNPFAIEGDLLTVETNQIENNGICFAVQEQPKSDSDLVLALNQESKLIVTQQKNLKASAKPLATIIAWEKRLR